MRPTPIRVAAASLACALFAMPTAAMADTSATGLGSGAAGQLPDSPVAAVAEANESLPILTAVITPDDPTTPTQLHVIQRGNRTVWLDWNEVAGATAYKIKTVVYANPDNITPTSVGVASVDFANSAGKVAGLTNGVTYAFSVAAVVSGKTSVYSQPVISAPNPAGQPTDFHKTDEGYGRVDFDWLPVDRATGYKIKTVVVNANGIANPAAGTTVINAPASLGYVSGLTNGVTYGFTVTATVDAQDGPPSAQLTETTAAVPNTPGTPTATTNGVTATAITLTWTASTLSAGAGPVSGYRIEATPTVVGDPITVDTPTAANTYTVTGLTKGMSYSFRVAGVNAQGKGLYSPRRTYTATGKAGVVRNLTAKRSADGTTIYLDWLAPSNTGGQDPTSYAVTSVPVSGYIQVDTANTSAQAVGLDRAATYKYTVKAVNDSGSSLGVSIGVLADQPAIDQGAVMDAAGNAVLTFAPLDDEYLDYQAEAYQILRNPDGSQRTPVYKAADSIDCSPTLCTATWEDFTSLVNGQPWAFRVRATDGIDTYSGYSSSIPDEPTDAFNLVTPVWSGTAWSIKYTADWNARASQNVAAMSVNGAPVANGQSGSLGTDPGEVVVELMGLGGQSTAVFNLTSPEPPAPDPVTPPKLGEKGAAGGTIVYIDAAAKYYYEASPYITSHGPYQDAYPDPSSGYTYFGMPMFMWLNYGTTGTRWAPSTTPPPCMVNTTLNGNPLWQWAPTFQLGTELGAGPENTRRLFTECAPPSVQYANDGFNIAKNYNQGGKTDWFIPSAGDLNAAVNSGGMLIPSSVALFSSSNVNRADGNMSLQIWTSNWNEYFPNGQFIGGPYSGWDTAPWYYGGNWYPKGSEMSMVLFRKQSY